MTIRDVPLPIYRALVHLAERNRRSLQQQLLVLLEHARALDRTESPWEVARTFREGLAGRKLGNTVRELRAERGR